MDRSGKAAQLQNNDEEPLMASGVSQPQNTQSIFRRRIMVFSATLAISGIVVLAVASRTESIKRSATKDATFLIDYPTPAPFTCTTWTSSEKAAIQANADEKQLCQLKALKDKNKDIVWRPNGAPCSSATPLAAPCGQAGTSNDCCERVKWQCVKWTNGDVSARNAGANEKLLCEKKYKDLPATYPAGTPNPPGWTGVLPLAGQSMRDYVYKFMPGGNSCTIDGCTCCVQERYTPL